MEYKVTFDVCGKKFRAHVEAKDASQVREKIEAFVLRKTKLDKIEPVNNDTFDDIFKQFFG